MIAGWTVWVVKDILAQLKSEALKTGLEETGNKTKHMKVMRNLPQTKQNLNADGQLSLNDYNV
jgi:hypothetical protein